MRWHYHYYYYANCVILFRILILLHLVVYVALCNCADFVTDRYTAETDSALFQIIIIIIIKFSLEQVTKAQRGSRGIALLFL
jgi:hypothetical protein